MHFAPQHDASAGARVRLDSFQLSPGFDMPPAGGRACGPNVRCTPFLFQRPESVPDSVVSGFRDPGPGDGTHGASRVGNDALSDSSFDTTDIDAMLHRLEELRQRHRELDTTIEQLESSGANDIQIMGLKREKLRVKDKIAWLSSHMTPDIIA
jgi:hypothetical protein